jgi:predicted dehydrogenase
MVDEMIAVSKETGQLLTGFQNYRYDSDFLKIKEVLESGVLGRPVLIRFTDHKFCRRWDWQTLKRFGGGLLNNMGPHLIDWALLLVDDPEPEVLAHMETTPLCAGDAESHVKLIMRPENGPMIDIEITQTNAYPQESFLVMGTQGSLTGNRKVVRWKYFKPEDVAPLVLDTRPTPNRSYNRETLPWIEESYQPYREFSTSVVLLYRGLYATIREGAPLAITPESVRRQIVVLEKCREQSGV